MQVGLVYSALPVLTFKPSSTDWLFDFLLACLI